MTIRVFAAINQKRDLILRGRDKDTVYHLDHRILMFYSDLIPMQAAISIFMGVFAFLLLSLPSLVDETERTEQIVLLSRVASFVPISGLVGYTLGGFKDIFNVGSVLSRRKKRLQSRTVASVIRDERRILLDEVRGEFEQIASSLLTDRADIRLEESDDA